MPFGFSFTKAPEPTTVATTIPLATDLSTVQYPEDNYSNFAKEGYGKSAIVHACIRELSTGVATPRYYVGARGDDGGVVEVENSPSI